MCIKVKKRGKHKHQEIMSTKIDELNAVNVISIILAILQNI